MDFDLEWHQEELRRAARGLLAERCTPAALVAWEEGPDGFSRELYREMGEMGWLALGQDEGDGRAADAIELAVLYEEIGRAALPGPHFWSALVAARLLGALGGDASLRAALATGARIATVAVDEPESGRDPGGIQLRAVSGGPGVRLRGVKAFVPWAEAADTLLVLARTGDAPENLTFFAVPAGSPGLAVEGVPMLSGERCAFLRFEDVEVAPEGRLGPVGGGWQAWSALVPFATTVQAAELTGIAEAALELGVQYAKERIAFGRPIGSFQAIQHKCAEMAADRDGARFLTYEAVCLLNEGRASDPRVLLAKVFAAGAAHRVTKEAHQIYAAAGFVRNHAVNFLYRRAKGLETSFGDFEDHLARAATALAR